MMMTFVISLREHPNESLSHCFFICTRSFSRAQSIRACQRILRALARMLAAALPELELGMLGSD